GEKLQVVRPWHTKKPEKTARTRFMSLDPQQSDEVASELMRGEQSHAILRNPSGECITVGIGYQGLPGLFQLAAGLASTSPPSTPEEAAEVTQNGSFSKVLGYEYKEKSSGKKLKNYEHAIGCNEYVRVRVGEGLMIREIDPEANIYPE